MVRSLSYANRSITVHALTHIAHWAGDNNWPRPSGHQRRCAEAQGNASHQHQRRSCTSCRAQAYRRPMSPACALRIRLQAAEMHQERQERQESPVEGNANAIIERVDRAQLGVHCILCTILEGSSNKACAQARRGSVQCPVHCGVAHGVGSNSSHQVSEIIGSECTSQAG